MENIINTIIENWQSVAVLLVVFGMVIIAIIVAGRKSNMSFSKGKVTFANTNEALQELETKWYKRGKAYRDYTSRLEKETRQLAYFEKPERLRSIRNAQMKRFTAEANISYIDNLQEQFNIKKADPQALQRDLGRIHLLTELLNYKVKEQLAELVIKNHFASGSEAEFKERIENAGKVLFSEVETLIDSNHHFEVIDPVENRNFHRDKMPQYLDILTSLMYQSRHEALQINDRIGSLIKAVDRIEAEYDKGNPIDQQSLDYWREEGRRAWNIEKAKDINLIYGVEELM